MRDGPKVAGIAQRVVKGASLTTGVLAVGSPELLRAVTADVYSTLGLPLDVSTVGAINDRYPGIEAGAVADMIIERASTQFGSLAAS
jgi:lipoate-protein ligase A